MSAVRRPGPVVPVVHGTAGPSWRYGGSLWGGRGHLEVASVPVLVGLVVIALVFQAADSNFLSPDNLVNLSLRSAATGIITLGVVLVLLVGQIDLSVGAVSGLGAAVAAVGLVQQGWSLPVSVLVALAVGALIGLVYGLAYTSLGVPSFVLTLAGLLVATGLQAQVLRPTGSVNLPYDSALVRFTQQVFLPPLVAYLAVLAVVTGYAVSRTVERTRRVRSGLPVASRTVLVTRTAVLAVVLLVPCWYLNLNRGVGASVALLLVLVSVTDVLLRRTVWGRAVLAVGSNPASALRAGLPVRRVYLVAFTACTTLAALGGVLAAGRLTAANQGIGGSDLNLTAIAAAVIGGTSLFGGRGSAWSAVLGALVIHAVASGLTLLNLDASVRYVVTGLVLALAVTADAVSRRARPATRR